MREREGKIYIAIYSFVPGCASRPDSGLSASLESPSNSSVSVLVYATVLAR
jgi:hypothetical protein